MKQGRLIWSAELPFGLDSALQGAHFTQQNKKHIDDKTVYVQSQQFTQAMHILHEDACGARVIFHVCRPNVSLEGYRKYV